MSLRPSLTAVIKRSFELLGLEIRRLPVSEEHRDKASPTSHDYIAKDIEIHAELLEMFDPAEPLVIFDIGACEGLDSIRYSRLFPNAVVYAFEPRADNIAKMVDNLVSFRCENVYPVREAISNQVGKATFHLSSGQPAGHRALAGWDYGNKSSSLLAPNLEHIGKYWTWLRFDETTEVPTNTIENFCRQRDISAIDFIHVDVQGAEQKVFEGAGDLLAEARAIWTEVSEAHVYTEQPLQWEIEKFLAAAGFAKRATGKNCYGSQSDELYTKAPKPVRGRS
jgi:FkbM family methyltransferase